MKKIITLLTALLVGCSLYAQNGFQASIEVEGGKGLDKIQNFSFGAKIVAGYKFIDLITIGAGVGYEYLDGLYYVDMEGKSSTDARSVLQVLGRIKVNLTKTKISPYIGCDLGRSFSLGNHPIKMANGFFYEPGVGCDFRLKSGQGIYFFLGYNSQKYAYESFTDVTEKTRIVFSGQFKVHLGFRF